MGSSMCSHLLEAGLEVRITNRTRSKATSLVDKGALWCSSAEEVAVKSSIVITMLGTPDDVRDVYFGSGGVLDAATHGSVLVDMTTSQPSLAAEIHEAAQTRGLQALDAPVTGGDAGATAASLVIMVGGTPDAYERVLPVLRLMGKVIKLQGGPGRGQHAKMTNQIAVASGMLAICESLLYASRAGLDLDLVISTISTGAAGSWLLSNNGPKMLGGDFEPGFRVDHFVKDLGIALREARNLKLALPGLALAEQLYVAASAQGLGTASTNAIVVALANLSGVPWPPRP